MIRPSLIDKCKSLINLLSSSYFLLVVLALMIGLAIYLYKSTKKDIIKTKKIYIIGYCAVLLVVLAIHYKQVFSGIGYVIDQIFIALCFPGIFVYLIMLVVLNIVFFKTIFKKEYSKYMKIVHLITYFFIHFIAIILITMILQNQMDITSKVSLYANETFLNISGLGIGVFLLWFFFILVHKLIRKLTSNVKEEPVETYRYVNGIVEIPSTVHIETDVYYDPTKEKKAEEPIKPAALTENINVNLNKSYEDMSLSEYRKLREQLIGMTKTETKRRVY